MRTNVDETASNVSDGVVQSKNIYSLVQLTEKYVSGQRLCIARSRITVCYSYNVGWRVEE